MTFLEAKICCSFTFLITWWYSLSLGQLVNICHNMNNTSTNTTIRIRKAFIKTILYLKKKYNGEPRIHLNANCECKPLSRTIYADFVEFDCRRVADTVPLQVKYYQVNAPDKRNTDYSLPFSQQWMEYMKIFIYLSGSHCQNIRFLTFLYVFLFSGQWRLENLFDSLPLIPACMVHGWVDSNNGKWAPEWIGTDA